MLKAIVPTVFLAGLTPLYTTGNLVWKPATKVDARGSVQWGWCYLAPMAPVTSSRLTTSIGNPLWHARIGSKTNAPETYMLDGHPYVIVGAADSLYAFYLP